MIETVSGVGVAVMRVQPSLWSQAQEACLAELYVVPSRRGQGHGRELITEAIRIAREQGADYAFLVTSATCSHARRHRRRGQARNGVTRSGTAVSARAIAKFSGMSMAAYAW